MILKASFSCGMCKNFSSMFSGVSNGNYGYCKLLKEYVHSNLVCNNVEIDEENYNVVITRLQEYREEVKEYCKKYEK